MPKIVQQTNRPAPTDNGRAKSASVLDRIAPVAASKVGRMKCSFYGEPKVGKTRLLGTFPKPLLIIGTEDGTASIAGVKGVDFVFLERTDEIYDLIDGPIKAGKYKTVGLDHATKLREKRIDELWASKGLGGDKTPERKPFLYADKQWKDVWVQCSQDMRKLLGPLLDLPRVMELNVVIISQEGKLNYEDNSSSDLIKPSIGSALGRTVADWLSAECDFTGQCLIRQETTEQKATLAGTTTTTRVKTGKKEYCLRVVRDEIYNAGFRVPLGKELRDEFLVDPSYEKIVKLIGG